MALAQLLNRSCNSPDAVFRTLRDFLTSDPDGIDDFGPSSSNPGPGYELVDASYASGDPANTTTGDWCVLRSHGEADSYPHYLRLIFGSTVHQVWLYLHWDTDAHVGVAPVGTTYGNVYHNGAGQVLLWLHADLDEIHMIIKPQAQQYRYWTAYGRLKPDHLCYSGRAVQVAAAIAAGEGVVVSLPSWPDWAEAGRKIYNWDTVGMHELEITAVSEASRTITVAEAYDKIAGSWMTEDMLLFCHRIYNYRVRGNDLLVGLPPRTGILTTQQTYYVDLLPYVWAREGKYNRVLSFDVPINRQNEFRGRLGLMRDVANLGAVQGEAWTDEDGQPWRVYTAYDTNIALKEAV